MMTFIADIGNEAQLVELGERLSNALSTQQPQAALFGLDADFIGAGKIMLAALSGKATPLSSRLQRRLREQGLKIHSSLLNVVLYDEPDIDNER